MRRLSRFLLPRLLVDLMFGKEGYLVMSEQYTSGWYATGGSVKGAAHEESGLPNQDAIHWLPKNGAGLPLIFALSDGHGSRKSFRSQTGSHLAVEVATKQIQEFLEKQPAEADLSTMKRMIVEWLPQALVRRWEKAVREDLQFQPLTHDELDALEQEKGARERQEVEGNPLLAYGATLIVVIVASTFSAYLQLGDGDILTVSPEGEVSKPLPQDGRLIANETTSLCLPYAWKEFRVTFRGAFSDPPALILLASDGYSNSYKDQEAFFQVCSDLWERIGEYGLQQVEQSLPAWLAETSRTGSGDDISLGVLCRMDAVLRKTGIVVSGRGGGAYTSISEALKNAPSEIPVRVRPGVYHERLVLDKSVQILGQGSPEEIIVECVDSSCVVMQTDSALIRGLTLSTKVEKNNKEIATVDSGRGNLQLEACVLLSDSYCLDIYGSAHPIIQDCQVQGKNKGIVIREQGQGQIEHCNIFGHATIGVEIRDAACPTVSRCSIHSEQGMAVSIRNRGKGRLEDCEIKNHPGSQIEVLEEGTPVLKNCKVYGGKKDGIVVAKGGNPAILSCAVYQNGSSGIVVRQRGQGKIEDCEIWGNAIAGVRVDEGGRSVLTNCRIYAGLGSGILAGEGEITVQQCQIEHNAGNGIRLERSAKGTVEDCEIWENEFAQVHVSFGYLAMRRSTIYRGKQSGIIFEERGDGEIADCEISEHAGHSLIVNTGSIPRIHRCKIYGGQQYGLLIRNGSQPKIEQCEIYGHTSTHILIQEKANPFIWECTIRDGKGWGVEGRKQGQGMLEKCKVFGHSPDGVGIGESSSLTIRDSEIHHNTRRGIVIWKQSQAEIEGCRIFGHDYSGIEIRDRSDPRIRACRIYRNTTGVMIWEQGKGTLDKCEISDQTHCGVEIMREGDPQILNCKINKNGEWGFFLHLDGNASLEHNDLTGNVNGPYKVERQPRRFKANTLQ